MFMREVYWAVSRRLMLLILLLVVAAALLFARLPIPPTYAGRAIENAGHLPVFLLVTFGLLTVLRADYRVEGVRLYALAGLLGAGLGFVSEVIQRPLARDASWEDVFSDAMGALCALALYALFDRRTAISRPQRLAAFVVALACLAFYLAPLVRMGQAYVQRNARFPVLVDFAARFEPVWIVGYGTNRNVIRGALDVNFSGDGIPGVSLREPVPDWSGYKFLVVDVENPDAQVLNLGVRVHDRGHGQVFSDRFNRGFALAGGERRTLRIALEEVRRAPRGRLMDMGHISDITLFRDGNRGSRGLRIYSMHLE
jgi:VanZ family protein